MNKTLLIAAAAVIGLSATVASFAFASSDHHEKGMHYRMERMTEHLNLSAEQQAQIQTMIEQQMQKRQAERAQMQDNIRSVLNEEQQATFDTMRSQHEGRMKHRMAKYEHDGEYCEHKKGRHHEYKDRYDD